MGNGIKAGKVKKKKSGFDSLPRKTQIVYTNYLTLANTVLTLNALLGWEGEEQFKDFFESYIALLGENADQKISVSKMVEWASEVSGFDIISLIDEVHEKNK